MNATRVEAAQIESLKAGLRSALADPSCPVAFSPLLMECAQVLTRLAAADRLAPDTAAAVAVERDANANLLMALMEEKPWKEKQWARCALAIGARAIKRGRLLTDREKLENLAKAFEDGGDKDNAAALRKAGPA